MNNQKIGKSFEQRWAAYLHNLGYWVHFLSPSANGSQPFDLIAIGRFAHKSPLQVLAMDCKTLSSGDRFSISRAEENQILAFRALNQAGAHNTYFVIECPDKSVRLIPSQDVDKAVQQGKKSIQVNEYDTICSGV